ncbi:helix-turn-helix domain-containing protein [Streptomyces sp. SM14]|uniref:helix-turn-helix domain-containing protein n=1 Tax=Streptomyces sp. SM14 TaxID=1736045 RepID=UPI000CD4D4C9|nr:helix-turn-helix domain-containing protein [Streptomyces sp. SM14]
MLSQTVFRSDDVPPEHRKEAWRECISRALAPMEIVDGADGDFHAYQRLVHLDTVSVWPATMDSCHYVRASKQVRQSDPGNYHITVLRPDCGELRVAHEDRQTTHRPCDLYMLDTSTHAEADSSDYSVRVSAIGVEVPKRLVPAFGREGLRPLLGQPLSGRHGFGALFARFVATVAEDSDIYGPADAQRLETVLVDLLSGLISRELEAESALSAETRARNLRAQIRSHIDRHLHDPELTPGRVAAAHYLSTRQLHRIFEDDDTSVTGYLRERRLERARRALAAPTRADSPVHAIAAQCGFTSAAHFSRAFRAAFGETPTDYRNRAGVSTGTPGATLRGTAPWPRVESAGRAGAEGQAPGAGGQRQPVAGRR